MTLRPRSIDGRLGRLHEVIRRLRRYREHGANSIRADPDLQWLVERGLQLGCEIVLDVGNHILAGAFGRTPESYEQILEALAAEGVVSASLRADMKGLGSFRNVLVHGYIELDPERVLENLDKAPEHFERYATEVHHWISLRRN